MAASSTTSTYGVEFTEEKLAMLTMMFTSRTPGNFFLVATLSLAVQMNALFRQCGPAEIVDKLDDSLPRILKPTIHSSVLQGRQRDIRALFS